MNVLAGWLVGRLAVGRRDGQLLSPSYFRQEGELAREILKASLRDRSINKLLVCYLVDGCLHE